MGVAFCRRQPDQLPTEMLSENDEVDCRKRKKGNKNKDAFSDRKNLVRGLCDASLIAANISQLRAVLGSGQDNKFDIPLLTLISLSLLSHVVFGIIIIKMWREKRERDSQHAAEAAAKQTQKQVSMQVGEGNQESKSMQETVVHQRISCFKNNCKHCRRYQMYDDLSILVVFFLVVFNIAISGLGLPTISQDC